MIIQNASSNSEVKNKITPIENKFKNVYNSNLQNVYMQYPFISNRKHFDISKAYDEIINNWSIEAKKENPAYFYNVNELNIIMSGKKSFVIGRKGSGKTSIAQHLCEINKTNMFSEKLSFKNFPFNILYSLENKYEYTSPNQYISIWKYLIYNYICKEMLKNNNIDSILREKLDKLYGSESLKQLDKLIENWTNSGFGVKIACLGFNYERTNEKKVATWIQATEILEKIILDYCDTSEYFIVFDELDEDYKAFDNNIEETRYMAMLTSLFKAVQIVRDTFDSAGKKILPVVFLRSDIYSKIVDSDKNKWSESIIDLQWSSDEMKNMISHRLSVAADVEETSFTNIWYSFFQQNKVRMGNRNSREMTIYDYIQRSTEMRPRDFVQYIKECATIAKDRNEYLISPKTVKDADEDFSEYLKRETKDELFAVLPEVNEILGLLSTIRKQRFSFSIFENEYDVLVNRGEIPKRDVKNILLLLFDAGVIGNQPAMKSQAIFRFSKKSPRFNFNEPMIIHRGLYKALQIY